MLVGPLIVTTVSLWKNLLTRTHCLLVKIRHRTNPGQTFPRKGGVHQIIYGTRSDVRGDVDTVVSVRDPSRGTCEGEI